MLPRPRWILSAAACSLLLAVACGGGSDDSASTGTAGGSAGASGSAGGTSGKGGAAGKAGSSGAAGSTGGAAGKAGSSGSSAGAAGQPGGAGGAAGKAGSAGSPAGAGGSAGSCNAPLTLCGGQCVDLTNDVGNCNKCGTVCPGATNATAVCDKGTCTTKCNQGFEDCDTNPANGCEVATTTDPNHCGSCATVCSGGNGNPGTCSGGKCGLSCATGTADCDKNPANGCEVNTQTDATNCGACGMSCSTGTCVMGACSCAGSTQAAELLPLDLYIMLDKSGSMSEATSSGTTKWDAVKAALNAFLNDPKSAGIGVGIEYFPKKPAGVPDTCTTEAQCMGTGPCDVDKGCTNSVNTITPCTTANDCKSLPGNGQCLALGLCANNQTFACFPSLQANCGMGLGQCQAFPKTCKNAFCSVPEYTSPEVEIAPLPGNAGPISTSMNANTPSGLTPTEPALQGAIDHAKTWAQANPTHTVVVLLATDGLPTTCNSTIAGASNIAASGATGAPPVKSFVIGVFTPADLQAGAQANVDMIAAAGQGQSTAFIVSTSMDVTQQFIDALNKIRTATLACDYALPVPQMGTFDKDKVNVIFTDGSGNKTTIFNVGSPAGCDPVKGGWYYDDPVNPTKIQVCKTTCDSFQSSVQNKVEIQLGCATVKP